MLTDKQAKEISSDDLATMVLRILQEREAMAPLELHQWQARTMEYPWNLGGIRETIFNGDGYQGNGSPERGQIVRGFREKFDEATQFLYSRALIRKDPTQSSEAFARLATRGKDLDTSAPIFGVTNTDGYLASVRGDGGPMDPVVEGYLRESYSAAEAELWLSATFMLGAASERLLFVAAEHIDALLKDQAESAKLTKLWTARSVKEWIVGHMVALRKTYPASKDAFTDVEDAFGTLFTLFRYQRNEVGHPAETMPKADPAHVKAMLLTFGTFYRRVAAILAVNP